MDFAELMFQMYAEPGNSYGDITRYFVKNSIKVYDKALQRAFISKLLRNPVMSRQIWTSTNISRPRA